MKRWSHAATAAIAFALGQWQTLAFGVTDQWVYSAVFIVGVALFTLTRPK